MPDEEFLEPDDENESFGNYTEAKSPQRRKKILKWLLLILLLLLVIFLSYAGYLKYKYNKMIIGRKSSSLEEAKNLVSPELLRGEETGDVNILFLGMRPEDMAGAYLSSAMMIINLDVKNNKTNLISIPRDLWMPIDGNMGKANSVYKTAVANPKKYPQGGIAFAEKTFGDTFGIKINYAFVANFDGFQKIIDDLGKVDVKISAGEAANYPFLADADFQSAKDKNDPRLYRFDGKQSLTFVSWPRDAVPDFDRLRRMQLFVFSAANQYLKISTLLDAPKTNEVLNIAGDNIKVDIQLWEMKKILDFADKVDFKNIKQYKLTTDVGSDGGLLRESHYFNTTYNPIAGDNDFSQIQNWAKNIIAN